MISRGKEQVQQTPEPATVGTDILNRAASSAVPSILQSRRLDLYAELRLVLSQLSEDQVAEVVIYAKGMLALE